MRENFLTIIYFNVNYVIFYRAPCTSVESERLFSQVSFWRQNLGKIDPWTPGIIGIFEAKFDEKSSWWYKARFAR